jgi:hypothetical protein
VFPAIGGVVLAKFRVTLKFPADPVLLPKEDTVISVFVVLSVSPAGKDGDIVTFNGLFAKSPAPP